MIRAKVGNDFAYFLSNYVKDAVARRFISLNNVDLNDIQENGVYMFTTGAAITNRPFAEAAVLIVFKAVANQPDAKFGCQICIGKSGKMAYRYDVQNWNILALESSVNNLATAANATLTATSTAIQTMEGWSYGVFTYGKIIKVQNGILSEPADSDNFGYCRFSCAPGDQFLITGTGGNNGRLWVIADSNGDVIPDASGVQPATATAYVVKNNFLLTIPAEYADAAQIVFNADMRQPYTVISNFSGNVTPEMFGAKGDDSTNDKAAIEKAIATGKPVEFSGEKTYRVSGKIQLNIFHLIGNGARIRFVNDGGFEVDLHHRNHQYMENLRLAGDWTGKAINITPTMSESGYPAQPGIGSMYKNIAITSFTDGFWVNLITYNGVPNTNAAACIRIEGMEVYNCVRYGICFQASDSILHDVMVTECFYGLLLHGGNSLTDARLFMNGNPHRDVAPGRASLVNTYGLKVDRGDSCLLSNINCADNSFHGVVFDGCKYIHANGIQTDSNNRWIKRFADDEAITAAMEGEEGAGFVITNCEHSIIRGTSHTRGYDDDHPHHTQHRGCEITGCDNCDLLILEDRMSLTSIVENNTNSTIRLTAQTDAGSGSSAGDCELAQALAQFVNYNDINTFAASPSSVEIGNNTASVALAWTFHATPTSLTLNGVSKSTSSTGETVTATDDGSTHQVEYTLATSVGSKKVTFNFWPKVYYGAAEIPETVNSAFLLGLSNGVLTGSRARTITVNAASGKYIWYAVPTRYGACTFKVGGFDGGFEAPQTVSITNASGYTENYYVYRSTNASLGSASVVVS